MSENTREIFIAEATKAFSDKGFHGTSIASIADRLGLTKQALLHHFGTKERLYGEVLARISKSFNADLETARASAEAPADQLEAFFTLLLDRTIADSDDTRLLMRELLDNHTRAETADVWYLEPALNTLIDLAQAATGPDTLTREGAFARIYQLFGAVTYFAVSAPTLEGIFGERFYAGMHAEFTAALPELVRTRFSS